MNILFYNHTGQIGGAERVLLTILAGFDRTNVQPLVICPEQGPLQNMIMELGVPVEKSPVLSARFTWRPDYALKYLQSFARVIGHLRKQITRFNPEVIHANSVRAGLVATFATIGLSKPIIWHIHDVLPRHPFNPMIRLVALASKRTRVVAVAHASAARFNVSFLPFKRQVTVIPNGIDVAHFHPRADAAEKIRSELKLSEGERIIAMVGRLTPTKGQLEVLRVLPEVLASVSGATLLLAGSPAFNREHEYADLLRRTIDELGISDRVRMLGERDDVATIMQAADVVVLNSSTEACPLVVLEAMACGTAVIATSVGDTSTMITQGEDGWIIAPRNSAALKQAIVTLLGDEQLRTRLGQNARYTAVARFSCDRFQRDMETLYSQFSRSATHRPPRQILDEKLAID